MAAVIHLLGRAGKCPTPGANLEGATLLAPDSAEVREDLIRRLGPSLGEGVEECGQGLGAGHVSARGLAQGNGAFFEIAGKICRLVDEVEAESQNGEGETTWARDGFDQKPGQLLILPKEVVRPFQAGLQLGQGADRVGRRQRTEEGKPRELLLVGFQQKGAPEAERAIGSPGVTLASPAGGLNFRHPDGRDLRGFSGDVLGGAGLGGHMDVTPKRVFRREEGVDEGGIERIGGDRPRGVDFRGRNCRKS